MTPAPTLTASVTKTPAATYTPRPTGTTAASANAVPIGALTTDHVGQTFTVRGKVVDTSSFSAGFKFVLDDGTGKISLTLFNDDYKFVPDRAGLNLGADVQVTAEVAEFQGALELQPRAGRDVQILTPGTSANVPVTPINKLGKPGERAAIEGTITEVKGFSSGTNLSVDDGTGNIRVTLFNNVLAYVPNARQLVPGAKVRVYGKTDFFGRLELVPQLGYDVTLQ
jgi:RecJ-like exonuclease